MKLTRLFSGLFLFTLFNLFILNVALPSVAPTLFSRDLMLYVESWADAPGKHKGQGDSWTPMTAAYRHYQESPEELIYSKIFFEEKTKFQYPPTSLFVMTPLQGLAEDQTFRLINGLNWISWLFVLFNGPLAAAIYFYGWERLYGDKLKGRLGWGSVLLVGILGALYYPMLRGYHIGQIQVWLNGMASLLILFWLRNWQGPAGILVGLMCLIKPQYGVIYLWGVARRRWPFVIAATLTGGLGVLLSLTLFGWANHFDYFPAVSFMSRHGEVFYANQSVNGLLNRWFQTGPVMGFLMNEFAAYHPVVYWGTLSTSLLLVVVALYTPHQQKESWGDVYDLSAALMIGTMASPIAWEHHYGILLPIYAVILPLVLKYPLWREATLPALTLSFLLTSNYFILFNRFWAGRLNVLLSYLFFGALILLGLLLAWRIYPRAQIERSEESLPLGDLSKA
ncbi:MAG: glycosyltransferase family 87 protein [Chloroflexota bacterium]